MDKIPSPSGGQESAFSGRQMSSFLHSHASSNRETSAEGAKNTGVFSLKPAVDNERRRKGKGQASSSVPTGTGQTDDKRSKGSSREYIVGDGKGVWKTRTLMRRPLEERWDEEVLGLVGGVPWQVK